MRGDVQKATGERSSETVFRRDFCVWYPVGSKVVLSVRGKVGLTNSPTSHVRWKSSEAVIHDSITGRVEMVQPSEVNVLEKTESMSGVLRDKFV